MEYFSSFFKKSGTNQILDELCCSLPRINKTKEILEHIQEFNLQDENNINMVILDETLAKLLNSKVDEKISYYEIQQRLVLENRDDDTNHSPFTIPATMSDELCDFLNMESGSKLSRLDITKHIFAYIRKNKLTCKNYIVLDETLAKLLNGKVEQTIEYYEVQDMLRSHLYF